MATEIIIAYQSKRFLSEIQDMLGGIDDIQLLLVTDINQLLEPDNPELNPLLIIQEAIDGNVGTSEWTQTAKMTYPHVPLIVIYSSDDEIVSFPLLKNGANYILQRPFDDEFIMDAILQLVNLPFTKHIPIAALESIRVRDLEISTTLDFDLYTHLPSNKKTLCLRRKGSTVDQELIDKVSKKGKGQQLYVLKKELPYFFSYASKILRKRGAKDTVSLTEKAIKTKANVQKFMSILLDAELKDFNQGKEILALCQDIINELGVLDEHSNDEIFERIIAITERPRTNYNAAINVCVYTCCFAQALNIEQNKLPQLAMASLLHNIGISKLSMATVRKPLTKLHPEEKAEYETYPAKSIILVKGKRMPLDDITCKAIEQHMENVDGSGFPKNVRGHSIHDWAKLIRIASEFQKLTSISDEEHNAYTPTRALDIIREKNNPLNEGVSPKLEYSLLHKISSFFEKAANKN